MRQARCANAALRAATLSKIYFSRSGAPQGATLIVANRRLRGRQGPLTKRSDFRGSAGARSDCVSFAGQEIPLTPVRACPRWRGQSR
jgi:hypothetical protein